MTFPAGWGLQLDPGTHRTDGGRVLTGGYPFRIVRFTEAGARWLDRVAGGEPVPPSKSSRRLARRLVDAGVAYPKPLPAPPGAVREVTVVIPVRDDAAGLRTTLAAIGTEVGAIVVVDDGATDPLPEIQGVTVVRHEISRGPAAARQTGWRRATTPIVAFLDADIEAEPGWLETVLAHFGDPTVGAVAPRVRPAAGQAPEWLARYEASRSPLDLGPVPGPVRPHSRVAYVPTAALVVRRAALEAVDGFDVNFQYGEDVDLVWRLRAAGWSVWYDPAAEVRHPSRPTFSAWLRQRVAYGSSAAPLAERHPGAVAPLGISRWSALAWGAVVAGHPVAGAAVAANTTAAFIPRLASFERPAAEALRIAGLGHLWAGRNVADALRRPWWPLAALLAWKYRRSRPALVAAAVIPSVIEWYERRPPLDLARFSALRLLDDLAYGTGVWAGCIRAGSLRALVPRLMGSVPAVSDTVTARSIERGPTHAYPSSDPVVGRHGLERRGHRARRAEDG